MKIHPAKIGWQININRYNGCIILYVFNINTMGKELKTKTKNQLLRENRAKDLRIKQLEKSLNLVTISRKDTSSAIAKNFNFDLDNLTAREYINMEDKLHPIQSWVVRYFNPIKWEWFIIPEDWWKDISVKYIEKWDRMLKDWEYIHYIKIHNEALPTHKGSIKKAIEKDLVRAGTEVGMAFVTPDNWWKDVMIKNTHMNLDYFLEGDDVEFVANKKWIIVAIQKIEK